MKEKMIELKITMNSGNVIRVKVSEQGYKLLDLEVMLDDCTKDRVFRFLTDSEKTKYVYESWIESIEVVE